VIRQSRERAAEREELRNSARAQIPAARDCRKTEAHQLYCRHRISSRSPTFIAHWPSVAISHRVVNRSQSAARTGRWRLPEVVDASVPGFVDVSQFAGERQRNGGRSYNEPRQERVLDQILPIVFNEQAAEKPP
jgi:hypothetical protein